MDLRDGRGPRDYDEDRAAASSPARTVECRNPGSTGSGRLYSFAAPARRAPREVLFAYAVPPTYAPEGIDRPKSSSGETDEAGGSKYPEVL